MTRPPFAFSLLAATGLATAQEPPVRFVTKEPTMVRLAVHDAPAFVKALQGTRLGTMLADADIAETFGDAVDRFDRLVGKWVAATKAVEALDPKVLGWDELVQRELWSLAWRDLQGGELVATTTGDLRGPVQTTLLLEPVPAAEARLAERFDQTADAVWKLIAPDDASRDAKIGGFPARLATKTPSGREPATQDASGVWYVHLPGQFAAGVGSPDAAGECRTAPPGPPGAALHVDLGAYLGMLASVIGEDEPLSKLMKALGVGETCRFEWRVAPRGELLQDDITLRVGNLAGLFAALVHAAAPLVDQALPDGAMLQIRCTFDVRELIGVLDEVLALSHVPSLQELGVAEDLHKAWTGGVALGICTPIGSPVPRVFASFGVVDSAALDRLLARLTTAPSVQKKDVTLEDVACVQLKLPDLPPALSPTWCVRDGVIHFAESGTSMRALLKATNAHAPGALDVGKTPRPEGKGAIVPGFDLRYDGVAMYAAYRDTWLPLLELGQGLFVPGNVAPLLSRKDLPDAKTMAEHLVRGRGVLRQLPDGLVLSTNGTVGGPALLAFLTTFGPTLSPSMLWSWSWSTQSLQEQVTRIKLEKTHAAIEAFTKRTGRRPDSLADLIGTELTDASTLLVDGDEATEPLLRDGKEVGRTSFRYFREAVEVVPQNDTVKVHLIALQARQWTRLAVGADGTLIDGYGAFATQPIDDLLKK